METTKLQLIKSMQQHSGILSTQLDPEVKQYNQDVISLTLPFIKTTQSTDSVIDENDLCPPKTQKKLKNSTKDTLLKINAGMQITLIVIDKNNSIVQYSNIDQFDQFLVNNKGKEGDVEISIKQVNIHTIQISNKGKVQVGRADTIIASGKNIGKKSETTILQQALQEAYKKYQDILKKKNDKYPHFMLLDLYQYQRTTGAGAKKTNSEMQFPQYIQRKYDGLRCGAFKQGSEVILLSRGHKAFTTLELLTTQIGILFQYIDSNDTVQQQLKQLLQTEVNSSNFMIDGELYIHNKPLQTLNSIIRNGADNLDKQTVQLLIYDVDITFKDRQQQLKIPFQTRLQILKILTTAIMANTLANIHIAPTYTVSSVPELNTLFQSFIVQQYEGAVIRSPQSLYCYSLNNRRSPDSLKYKLKLDMEVQIVNFLDGQGKDSNSVIFNCQLILPTLTRSLVADPNDQSQVERRDALASQTISDKESQTFQVVQNTTYDKRKSLFKLLSDKPEYLTILSKIPFNIEYSGLSNNGTPLQPRGIYFRMEDIDFIVPSDLLTLIE